MSRDDHSRYSWGDMEDLGLLRAGCSLFLKGMAALYGLIGLLAGSSYLAGYFTSNGVVRGRLALVFAAAFFTLAWTAYKFCRRPQIRARLRAAGEQAKRMIIAQCDVLLGVALAIAIIILVQIQYYPL